MTSLREFIQARRSQIQSEVARLNAELAELAAAEEALPANREQQSKDINALSSPVAASDATAKGTRRPRSGKTIKDLVLDVLTKQPRGGDVHQIIKFIKDFHQEDVSRPSLSPQLSRLARDGKISREGRRWYILTPLDRELSTSISEEDLLS